MLFEYIIIRAIFNTGKKNFFIIFIKELQSL